MRPIDIYYLEKEEPQRSYLQALREYILNYDDALSEAWKYGMPFFCYKGKMCCYLWTDKITGQPYLGVVEGKLIEHPALVQEKRARMKIMRFAADTDMPLQDINTVLEQMLDIYRK